jgi:hypothetical protein
MPVQLFAAIASLVLLGVVIELIRSRKLRERYALLWLATAGVILVFAAWRSGLHHLSDAVGIAYPPNALFVLAMLFVLVLLLHFSTVISKLSDRSTVLTQRLALMEERLRALENRPTSPSRLRDVSRTPTSSVPPPPGTPPPSASRNATS